MVQVPNPPEFETLTVYEGMILVWSHFSRLSSRTPSQEGSDPWGTDVLSEPQPLSILACRLKSQQPAQGPIISTSGPAGRNTLVTLEDHLGIFCFVFGKTSLGKQVGLGTRIAFL